MDLILIITFYVTSIISIKIDYSEGMIKKVDKIRLDLNITQDNRNIRVAFKSKEYIPAGGIWVSDMFTINDNEFLIEGIGFFIWVRENIIDMNSLNRFLDTIGTRTYEHIVDKEEFYKKANNLELGLITFKKEDFRKLAIEFLEHQKNMGSYGSFDDYEAEKKFEKKIQELFVLYIVRYNNKTNEIPNNLNDYELYVLKSSRVSNSFEILALLKRSAFDVFVSAILIFCFFGILLFAGRYSLSKYF